MSYMKSLRFKLMLLCVIPLAAVALLFIAHSVIIAHQVNGAAAAAYAAAAGEAGSGAVEAAQGVTLDLGWIARQWAVVFCATAVCCYIPTTIYIRKLITPIRQVSKYSDSLAEGDVGIEVVKNRTDEIGVLQESIKKLVSESRRQAELISGIADGDISLSYIPRSEKDVVGHGLVKMLDQNNISMRQIMTSSNQLASSTGQIAEGAQALAQHSSEQAASVAELSGALTDLKRKTVQNAENAKMAQEANEEAGILITDSEHSMRELLDAMRGIDESSNSIAGVIKVIDDIAFQTNILALNAAVEAARAGEHGKGFAVVADEVRNLASKSADAAKETAGLIEGSSRRVREGNRLVEQTNGALEAVADKARKSTRLVSEVAMASREQAQGIDEITKGMEQISAVVQFNSATAQESAASAEEMSSQAVVLNEIASKFKLRGF